MPSKTKQSRDGENMFERPYAELIRLIDRRQKWTRHVCWRVFPTPWTVVEATGEFIVKDANGRALAYFYWWGDVTTALLTGRGEVLGGEICQGAKLCGAGARRGELSRRHQPDH
jgi:hypothetical protein